MAQGDWFGKNYFGNVLLSSIYKKRKEIIMLGKLTEIDHDFEIISKDGVIRLDLGCGNNKKDGFTGVDICKFTQADIYHDLDSYPYPFEDNSVYEIYCSHFIEHVLEIKYFMEECYRILIPGGTMEVIAPYYSSIRAFQDYTHRRSISENTFLYFSKQWMENNGLSHYDVNCNFRTEVIKFVFCDEYKIRSDAAREWARKHNINVVNDIIVILRKI